MEVRPNTNGNGNVVIILATAALMVFVYGQIDYTVSPYSGWDLAQYLMVSEAAPALDPEVRKPFAYRLLGPYVIGLLPLPAPVLFYVFAVATSFAVLLLFYGLLCRAGIRPRTACTVTVLFSFNKYLFGYSVWNCFQLNDVLSLAYLVALFDAMHRRRWWMFGIVMVLGAVTRETAMLMLPTVCIYLAEKGQLSAEGKRLAPAVIVPLAVFVLLRLLITAPGLGLVESLTRHGLPKLGSPEVAFRLVVNAFAPLSLIPWVYGDKTLEFFRGRKYAFLFVCMVVLSTLFGSNNERLMAPAFVVFYWLIGYIVDAENLGENKPLMVCVVLGCFAASFHPVITRFPFMSANYAIAVSMTALVLITAMVAWHRFRPGRRPRSVSA